MVHGPRSAAQAARPDPRRRPVGGPGPAGRARGVHGGGRGRGHPVRPRRAGRADPREGEGPLRRRADRRGRRRDPAGRRAAAALVVMDYEELPAVTTPEEALPTPRPSSTTRPGATRRRLHQARARAQPAVLGPRRLRRGRRGGARSSAAVVDASYRTRSVHQGYLEPQACIVADRIHGPRCTSGSPQVALPAADPDRGVPRDRRDRIEIEPIALGGDFGGKGSPMDAPLCASSPA